MADAIANPNTNPKRYSEFWFRALEILPGACVWLALIAPLILSFFYPLWVTIFIIVFDVYWLVQTFNYSYILIKGYRRLKRNMHTDWETALAKLPAPSADGPVYTDWNELYQVIILATYKEELSILDASIQSFVDSPYPKERKILVLATEERAGAEAQEKAEILRKKYEKHFAFFLISAHPDIVGEVKAKGANASWAAKLLVKEIERRKIPLDKVVVSTADSDSRLYTHYFYRLAHAYVTTKDPVHTCYQPVATFFNNIWEAPIISRVLAFGTTFWQLIESVREYRLITFSTHAMSLQTLVDMNYWSTSIVNEDSRQYFRAYFCYKGNFKVYPLFVPIYMDAVHVYSLPRTLKSLYFQQQRWAYGVEHFPYIVLESLRQKTIPILDRTMLIWRAFWGTFSWATSSFFITLVGWYPIVLNEKFRDQVVVSNFISVTQQLLSLTWIGLIVSSIITYKILALLPHARTTRDWAVMCLQWFMVPFIGIFFGAIPGLDSQTRLMLGKYIGFRVTDKARKPA